jgi:L-lactate utilization protein LutC
VFLGTGLGARAKDLNASEPWGFVAFGDVGVVEGAFGVDSVGAVLLSSSAASGHHHAAIARWSVCL